MTYKATLVDGVIFEVTEVNAISWGDTSFEWFLNFYMKCNFYNLYVQGVNKNPKSGKSQVLIQTLLYYIYYYPAEY